MLSWRSIRGRLLGTQAADDAAAGVVGEYFSSEVAISAAVALLSLTNKDVCTLALPPGDFDVSGTIYFLPAGSTIVNQQAWINTVSVTAPADTCKGYILNTNVGTGQWCASVGLRRVSLAAAASVYLGARSNFSVGTTTVCGLLQARRVR